MPISTSTLASNETPRYAAPIPLSREIIPTHQYGPLIDLEQVIRIASSQKYSQILQINAKYVHSCDKLLKEIKAFYDFVHISIGKEEIKNSERIARLKSDECTEECMICISKLRSIALNAIERIINE